MNRPERSDLWKKNRALLADDHRLGRSVATGRPAHLKIELTNYCNLACPICPHNQMQREVGYMKPALFKKIIEEAAPELEFAYLHHLGESLFHGQIGELIRTGRASGAAMGLSTNATFLDERKGRALLENGLDFLVVSIDGASAESYERARVGADFATTVENVRRFFALKESLGAATTVVVQMILTDGNHHEVERFAADWRDAGAQVMIKRARDWAGQVQLKLHAPEPILHTPCKMLWSELTILWDGAVVPCVNVFEHENVLGQLNSQSLDEIWNGAPMQALRAAHLRDAVDDIRVCNTCPRHKMEHGDFVAVGQLEQRRRNYVRADLTPRSGLS